MTDVKSIAIIGTGVSGLSAAWLLSQRHNVTVYERARRIGGHSNTVEVAGEHGAIPVDTGFIVYNARTYPNLTALFAHLGVPTQPSDMTFSVSLRGGALEYSGGSFAGLWAQKRNLLRPRFWGMLNDLLRFYKSAQRDLPALDDATTLGDYLQAGGYGSAFRDDHLLPMAAAVWSAPARAVLDYPVASFVRFQKNHGLLSLSDRPQWRTVSGGSRTYVERLARPFADRIKRDSAVAAITRRNSAVTLSLADGTTHKHDAVVVAAHADDALRMLRDPSDKERRLLGAFAYTRNRAVLHTDPTFMPRRRSAWASWNHLGGADDMPPTLTYWMNALQNLPKETNLFVTLNPEREPDGALHEDVYDHPVIDAHAVAAQRELWTLQGRRGTWFCGAYFGAGFHEDGLQAGLAVAEALGGVRRPWNVADESGRIALSPLPSPAGRDRFAA